MVILQKPDIQENYDDIHVSASSVNAIIDGCPREVLYRYVLGLEPQDKSSSLILGSAMHEALAAFYLALQQSKVEMKLADMVEIAHGVIESAQAINFKEGETLETLKAQASNLLTVWHKNGYRPQGTILGVEMKFSIDLKNPHTGEELQERLLGYIDLLTENPDGTMVVTDHKTIARRESDRGQSQDLQMGLYQYAVETLFPGRKVILQFQDIIKTKSPTVTITPVIEQDKNAALKQVYSAITHMNTALMLPDPSVLLYRRPSWRCASCGYRAQCR
ncbi:PD-(D/E)XK nuclease family protein [Myxococcota bacterium]|nr:PD-(D/E)XK nuclease family protein [Myxococcota bacterium]MBU1382886.1 PD-(D/E)XK nuclease family protein [Myxococcota bacterium]MBU1496692.1 PD-(D/E)XK nuclease family protein [Myxococcota bacterium]